MDSNEQFWGMPQFVWDNLFEIIRVLVVGLTLGVFASRYQKRKEIELQIKGKILSHRIENLENIEKIIGELYNKIAPPLREQTFAGGVLDNTGFDFEYIEYAKMFNSVDNFDDYYRRYHAVLRSAHNYMSYRMEKLLSEYSQYLTELKNIFDAFCDTECYNEWKFPESVIKQHFNLAYQVIGAALQQDIDRFYCVIDQQIAKEMKNIDLSYGHSKYRKRLWNMKQSALMFLGKSIDKNNLFGKLCRKIYFGYVHRNYGRSRLITKPAYITLILMYVHYSDKYTPDQIADWPKEKVYQLINEFQSIYVANYHF